MKMKYLPHYCGGRFLFGLSNFTMWSLWDESGKSNKTYSAAEMKPGDFKKLLIQEHTKPRPRSLWYAGAVGEFRYSSLNDHSYLPMDDPLPFVPPTLDEFKDILKEMIAQHPIGVISAVTNSGQPHANTYLEACGFKVAGTHDKYGSTPRVMTWMGNMYKDVYPTLGMTSYKG